MKPRTIVFDLFGDHLRYTGGEARLQALSELLEVFGVGESTTRVVLARMRREGWFDTRRDGRPTIYSLTQQSWRLLDEGRTRIFDRRREPWDGEWRMVIYGVAEPDRPERERLRRTLTWLGFGPLAAATWVSPHPRLDDVDRALGETSALRLDLLTCRTRGRDGDREMAARCWDLDGLGRDYAELVESLRALPPVDALAGMAGRDALRLRVQLVSSYRTFPFRDPDLPAELLPEGWPGRTAHDLFVRAHDALAAPADGYVRTVLERHSG
ncbi:PaaX family transcriptional regulator [Modestobacter lapidis]|nr:PaaX family transcriptional regulator [Modestobacter lapidis]